MRVELPYKIKRFSTSIKYRVEYEDNPAGHVPVAAHAMARVEQELMEKFKNTRGKKIMLHPFYEIEKDRRDGYIYLTAILEIGIIDK